MTAPQRPPVIDFDARLVPGVDVHAADLPGSWAITHGLGGPAAGTYTEVVVEPNPDGSPSAGAPLPEHIVDAVVRDVAVRLYGTAWAFHYRPEQLADAVHRHGMRRRERVLIEGIEVYA